MKTTKSITLLINKDNVIKTQLPFIINQTIYVLTSKEIEL